MKKKDKKREKIIKEVTTDKGNFASIWGEDRHFLTSFLTSSQVPDGPCLHQLPKLDGGIVAKSVFASGSLFFEAEFS